MLAHSILRFPALGQGINAAISFVEHSGDAAGSAAVAGANVTTASAEVFVALSCGSLATLRMIWGGVGLCAANLLADIGTVMLDHASEASLFIASPEGVKWVRALPALRVESAEILDALGPTTVYGSFQRELFNVSGSCGARSVVRATLR